MEVTTQAKEIKPLKAQIKNLKRKAIPGRKPAKSEPTMHKDLAFKELDDAMDYIETEDAQDEGRTSSMVLEEKESTKKGGSSEDPTTTSTPTPIVFRDDETIAEFLVSMSQHKAKQKGVEIKDVEDSDKPMPTSTRFVLTLKPLPKIDPKDKGKKVLEEEAKSDVELEGKSNENFVAIGSAEDERLIKEMNKEKDPKKKRLKKMVDKETPREEDIAKVPAEQEVIEQDERLIKEMNEENDPKKKRLKKRVDKETPREKDIAKVPAEQEVIEQDSEIMEKKSVVSKLHKVSSPDGDYLVVYKANGHFRDFNYLMEIMMESSTEENDQGDFWNNQQEWEIVSWRLYETCGVFILELKDGTIIYMLVERRYPLSKELFHRMLDLGLEVEEESIAALHLIQEYALWDVVENGNSWVPAPVATTPESASSTPKMTVPATAEEKTCKKNDVKARSLLLMSLPNEHQLTFDKYDDAQSMFAAIKARFGGNEATKKTQKALLKQQYENFSGSSSESLDSIFNRLQKLVSRLAILGVTTSPEDLNLKFLRSLPAEWDTHVVVWTNKPNFETMGLDDLYNNFKIVEQKIKKSTGTSNIDKNLAFVTALVPSSTNDTNTAIPKVSTASTKSITTSTELTTATFSDATAYAFISRGSSLMEAILLVMINLRLNVSTATSWDTLPESAEVLGVRTTGQGSDMAEEHVQKNMALMAFSDSEVYPDKSCSKSCLKNHEALKKQCDDLLVKLNDIAILKREVGVKEYELGVLRSELENVKKEKDGIDFKITKFDKSAKDLGLDEFKELEVNMHAPRENVPLPTNNCEKESDNSEENTDDSLEQQQVSDSDSSSVESPLKVDKETVIDWKEKFFHPAGKIDTVKPKHSEKPVKRTVRPNNAYVNTAKGNPQMYDKGFVDSRCSRHMTGNLAYLSNFIKFDGGNVTFGGGTYGGMITGKGTLKTNNLDFEDVYFVNELKFNLFSVSQMCDKKNHVLFTDTECLVLSPEFKLPDENQDTS
ncbi:hypothetical protein Tco_1078629 [Tanacetum coccineum]|uniref:Retrovirus-related Pol polyprotein from transposon TNT 1-94-like beta-barrel domain-containing protein n=1 Tax=Tanacetum coccineum TaxID=301880 RepID=A0ABQ5HPN2_9ASTR